MIDVEAFPVDAGTIELRVERGEVVLLRGRNGSGKTSLLRSIAGLEAPVAPRRARVEGVETARAPPAALPPLLTLAPQDAHDALIGLTVEGEHRLRAREPAPDVAALRGRESRTLSSGEARRVALSLARGAPVLLLDEPSEGLDPEGRARLRALVLDAKARGCVVAADHAGLLDDLATRVVDLSSDARDELPDVPPPRGGVVLDVPAWRAKRGDRVVCAPALRLQAGLHALVGSNGAGKTTILLGLGGFLPDAPTVDARLLAPDARLALHRDSVRDELAAAEAWAVDALVPRVLAACHPASLSGGEAQRVALAKALGRAARCYLLDEPEAHLDAPGRAALVRVLARRIEEGACVLVATHDEALLARAATRTLVEAAS